MKLLLPPRDGSYSYQIAKGFEANMRQRAEFAEAGKKSPAIAREIRQACAEDIVFWINMFCYLVEPRNVAGETRTRVVMKKLVR